MIDKDKLIEIGFKPHTARSIIQQAKVQLVNAGFTFYAGRQVGLVPAESVEKILGISIPTGGETNEK